MISCFNVLQQVTTRYKRLQKIGMSTTFKVAEEIFFLNEGDKLLQHATMGYNALNENNATKKLM